MAEIRVFARLVVILPFFAHFTCSEKHPKNNHIDCFLCSEMLVDVRFTCQVNLRYEEAQITPNYLSNTNHNTCFNNCKL